MGGDGLTVVGWVRRSGAASGFVEPNIEHRVLVECSDGLFHAFIPPEQSFIPIYIYISKSPRIRSTLSLYLYNGYGDGILVQAT